MNGIRVLTAVALALVVCSGQAQTGSPGGPAVTGSSQEPGGYWGKNYTPGWSLMSTTERREHKTKMLSMKSRDECKAYMEQTKQAMMARAKEKGVAAPGHPKRDACSKLKG